LPRGLMMPRRPWPPRCRSRRVSSILSSGQCRPHRERAPCSLGMFEHGQPGLVAHQPNSAFKSANIRRRPGPPCCPKWPQIFPDFGTLPARIRRTASGTRGPGSGVPLPARVRAVGCTIGGGPTDQKAGSVSAGTVRGRPDLPVTWCSVSRLVRWGQPAHRRCCSRCCLAPMAECPGGRLGDAVPAADLECHAQSGSSEAGEELYGMSSSAVHGRRGDIWPHSHERGCADAGC
jgi:hypothetical protein